MPDAPAQRLSRAARSAVKRGLRHLLEAGQRLGVNILPRHYYAEVPDLRRLRREQAWRRPRSMVGIRGAELERQLDFVRSCCTPAIVAAMRATCIHDAARIVNGGDGFGPTEAEFLFAFVATHRPRRVVQIGCGLATAVMLHAAQFADHAMDITCIEPFPNDFLRRAAASGCIRLLDRPAEQVELADLCAVGHDGLLFVDSTHAVRPGGEVNRILLEVLPRLPEGAFIHFHDINFPYDYSRDLLSADLFFAHESVLLHALLVGNCRLELSASLSMLHYARREQLRQCLPNYWPAADADGLERGGGHFPSSVFLRVRTAVPEPGHGGGEHA